MEGGVFPMLHPLSSGPKLSLQMGSRVVASPFSTQFNRVMKWLPDSAGHTRSGRRTLKVARLSAVGVGDFL